MLGAYRYFVPEMEMLVNTEEEEIAADEQTCLWTRATATAPTRVRDIDRRRIARSAIRMVFRYIAQLLMTETDFVPRLAFFPHPVTEKNQME